MDERKKKWLRFGIRAGLRGNLLPDQVSEAYQIVYSALGDDWLREQEPKANAEAYGFFAGHPLMRNLRRGQENSTSEIVELAQYLKEFATEAAMPEFLARLRDRDNFHNCLFELAVACRFRRIGARVTFSPPTDRGWADFLVSSDQHVWICECTRQHLADDETRRISMRDNLIHQVCRKMPKSEVPATVKITLRPTASPSAFKRAPGIVWNLLKQLKEKSWACYTHEDKELFIIVTEFSDVADPNPARRGEWKGTDKALAHHPWEVVVDQSWMLKRYVDEIRDGKPPSEIPKEITGRLFVQAYSVERPIEPSILKKVKKKLSQSRVAESPHPRLILVETLGILGELDWKLLYQGMARLFDSQSKLAGVVLMNRRYNEENNRYGYGLYVLSNDKGGYPFPPDVLDALRRVEGSFEIY